MTDITEGRRAAPDPRRKRLLIRPRTMETAPPPLPPPPRQEGACVGGSRGLVSLTETLLTAESKRLAVLPDSATPVSHYPPLTKILLHPLLPLPPPTGLHPHTYEGQDV